MNPSPIILFVYNRPWHTEQTVEALKRNELASESDLFIFSDGPKVENDENVLKVREYIKTIDGFKSIIITERKKNMGLANSVIAGVTEIINRFGKVIVLEDDLVTSKYFLRFMNESLEFFENRADVFSISGYNYPSSLMKIPGSYKDDIFLSYRFGSTGWGSWKERWDKVDWEVKDFEEFKNNRKLQEKFKRGGEDVPNLLKLQMEGRIDSWAIRFDYSHLKNDSFNVRPVKSLIKNIGFDGSGIHSGIDERFCTELESLNPKIRNVSLSKQMLKNFKKVFEPPKPPPKYSLKRFLGKLMKRVFK